MRFHPPPELEKSRLSFSAPELDGYNSDFGAMEGAFQIDGPTGVSLRLLSSGVDFKYDWEHVSVSTELHCPSWEDMVFVKNLFWFPQEAVMQLHPPESDYVNHHPNCLHLWRPILAQIPLPPSVLVGPKK